MLETKRLILRNFQSSDIDDFFEYTSNKKVCEMSGWVFVSDKESAKIILNNEINKPNQFAIVLKENNKVIGSIELMKPNKKFFPNIKLETDTLELAYLLSEDYWGKGIMPEAISIILDFAFNKLNLSKILTGYFKSNTQSKTVQEKSGFKAIGQILFKFVLKDKTENFIQMALTKDEYLNTKTN